MLYELGLQATFAVCLWILIDLLGARGARARRLPVMCLAASCALWVVGELLTSGAQSDAQVLFGRRLLYLGISGTLLSWLWTSAVFSRARWLATRPWLLAVAALPMFGLYSLLWWDPNGHFLHWTAVPPQRGWAFWPFAGIGWLLTLIGSAHFFVAAGRLRRWPLRMAGVLVGCLMPLVGSVLYLGFGVPSNVDPTPILIGASGVVLRLSILDSGLAVMLPMGRRSVFEQLDTGALLADLQGIVVDANPAARRLLHRQDLLGCSLDDLLEEARSDKARVIEVERVSLRGRLRDVGTAALIKDRSEAVRLERQVQEQQRLENLGLLASGIQPASIRLIRDAAPQGMEGRAMAFARRAATRLAPSAWSSWLSTKVNSSPPMRERSMRASSSALRWITSDSRTLLASRSPTSFSSSSPARCPRESLTRLKLSRSSSIRPTCCLLRAASLSSSDSCSVNRRRLGREVSVSK